MDLSLVELTADMTRTITALIDRRDIIVRLDPTLPVDGQFNASTAQIAINLPTICTEQTIADLVDRAIEVGDDLRLLGVLAHEAGHAQHTPIRHLPDHLINWVDYLEEPRIESQMRRRHPNLVPAIAAAAKAAVGSTPVDGVTAIRSLILVGGRVHAGIFEAATVADVLTDARTFLDDADAATVEQIVAAGTTSQDSELVAMIRWAQQLFDIASGYGDPGTTGVSISHVTGREGPGDNDDTNPADASDAGSGGKRRAGETSDERDDHSPSDEDANDDADDVDGNGAGRPRQPDLTGVADAPDEFAEHKQEVPPAYIDGDPRFFSSTVSSTRAADWFTVRRLPESEATYRPVTAEDRAKVRGLQSWLAGAGVEGTIETVTDSGFPGGQLNPTELMRATAQHELGVTVTAKPWRRRQILEQPTAPIELGILCDRSQSMSKHLDLVATAAWTLQHGIIGAKGRARTWVFGTDAHVLPAQRGDRITIPAIDANTLALLPAITDYQRWVRPDYAAKVLIVISDGALYGDPVRTQLGRLAADGVTIVGITPRPTAVAPLANHLPDGAPIEVLDSNLITQIQRHLTGD